MTKAEQRLVDTINQLLENGWEHDGRTQQQTFRMPTAENPVYGGIGGKLVTTGGRIRLKKGESKVTLGKRTAYFWTKGKSKYVAMNTGIDNLLEVSKEF